MNFSPGAAQPWWAAPGAPSAPSQTCNFPPSIPIFFVARSARDNFHDFENSCEMPTLYRSHSPQRMHACSQLRRISSGRVPPVARMLRTAQWCLYVYTRRALLCVLMLTIQAAPLGSTQPPATQVTHARRGSAQFRSFIFFFFI